MSYIIFLLHKNAVAESCSRLCVDLLIVSLSFVLSISVSSANANERRNGLFLLGVERQSISAVSTRITLCHEQAHCGFTSIMYILFPDLPRFYCN